MTESENIPKPRPKPPVEKKFQPITVVDCNTDKPRIFTQCYKCDQPLLIQTHHDGTEPVDQKIECPTCGRIAFFAHAPKIAAVMPLGDAPTASN
ncbi:hypothetical protein [Rivularia sp. UHCC 0363]|uniref:hypothetical protein n=1 Tax=Rivularia sp. UHCC 0363 TaxID=3110244 RepID=UPI002B1F0202|nr:hypothetical protein [Rivularia sp. UHCC 0363]MEA5593033.1 hypothetical protein [Rivularia sp. UHCC 0363]